MAFGVTVESKTSSTIETAERRQRVIPHVANALKLKQRLNDEAWLIMRNNPVPTTTGWENEANCNDADPELFFPEKSHPPNYARELCLGCAVREACLVDAMINKDEFAVRGGLTIRERHALKKRLDKLAEQRRLEAADQ